MCAHMRSHAHTGIKINVGKGGQEKKMRKKLVRKKIGNKNVGKGGQDGETSAKSKLYTYTTNEAY